MDIERETIVEIGVSTVAVGLFVVALVAIGAANGGQNLTPNGGTTIIAALFGFVVLMAAVGAFLNRRP